jgi:6-pyruvoyltetrahydropterin/6-carboxytetrahydropterin synthase
MYSVVKRFGHEEGLSCCFRQWRAEGTHCKYLHSYALAFEFTWSGIELDHRNWLVSFGDIKPIRAWLHEQFDHITCIAADDPELTIFKELQKRNIIQLNILNDVGCEMFAEYVYDYVSKWTYDNYGTRVFLESVKVQEHPGNSAIYMSPILSG